MPESHVTEITRVIQLSVAPVFMLMAVGTLMGVLNTRLGRAVDRRRSLEERLARMPAEEAELAKAELVQIERRVTWVYRAIIAAVAAGILVCFLITGGFLGAFLSVDLSRLVGGLFVAGVLAVVVSLVFFLREVFLAVTTPRHVVH